MAKRRASQEGTRAVSQRSANGSVKGQMTNPLDFDGHIFFFVFFLQTFKKVKKKILTSQVIYKRVAGCVQLVADPCYKLAPDLWKCQTCLFQLFLEGVFFGIGMNTAIICFKYRTLKMLPAYPLKGPPTHCLLSRAISQSVQLR